MRRAPRFVRVAAACALTVSALALGMVPAGAVPTPTGSVTSIGDGTATITYADTTDVEVYIIDGASTMCEDTGSAPATGVLATLGVDNPMPASPVTVTTETQVGPLPLHALGTGSFMLGRTPTSTWRTGQSGSSPLHRLRWSTTAMAP